MNNLFVIPFAIALICLELIYFRIARAYKILDHPNDRSLHEKPTIRGGGIIFYLTALLYFVLTSKPDLLFILSLSAVAIVGFIDDIRSLSSSVRFIIQSFAFALVFYNMELNSTNMLAVALLFVISVGALNAFNFMDGINGLTGGYAVVLLGSLVYINNQLSLLDSEFILAIMVGVLIFCYFNFRTKAICFAGDVGSLSIGFINISLIMKLIITTGNYCFLMLVAVYGVDSILTIIHRLIRRENIFKAHRLHLFQVIVYNTRITHIQMSVLYMVVQLVCNSIVIYFFKWDLKVQYLISFSILLMMGLSYVTLKSRLLRPARVNE